MFQVSFERGEGDSLIGGPPSPEQDSHENVISVFVCKVVDPDNPFGTSVSNEIHYALIRSLLISSLGEAVIDRKKFVCHAWVCRKCFNRNRLQD